MSPALAACIWIAAASLALALAGVYVIAHLIEQRSRLQETVRRLQTVAQGFALCPACQQIAADLPGPDDQRRVICPHCMGTFTVHRASLSHVDAMAVLRMLDQERVDRIQAIRRAAEGQRHKIDLDHAQADLARAVRMIHDLWQDRDAALAHVHRAAEADRRARRRLGWDAPDADSPEPETATDGDAPAH